MTDNGGTPFFDIAGPHAATNCSRCWTAPSVLKKMHRDGVIHEPLKGKVLAMIFEKSSTRTRVSFEAGMAQFGGSAIFLSPRDTQLGRGEPVEDSSRVISRMVDIVMIRTFAHDIIERFAAILKSPGHQWPNRRPSPLPVAGRSANFHGASRQPCKVKHLPGLATATTCATPTSMPRINWASR
jgi:hypothetical protein